MTNIARKATLLAIFLYPLDGFKFSFFPSMSLYRLVLVFASVVGMVLFLTSPKIKIPRKTVLPFVIFSITSAVISSFISTEKGYANSAMLNEISGVILLFLIVTLFDYNDVDVLLKQFIRSTYIGVPFALFSWFVLFQNPSAVESILSFGGLFKIDITEELIASCYNMRLSLPFSSSSVYSGVLAIIIAILICDNTMYKRVHRNILILIFSLLLIMTQARTGMLALGIFIFIYILKFKDNKRKSRMMLLAVVSVFCVLLVFSSNEDFVRKLLARFDNTSSSTSIFEDRHFLVPLEGLRIWLIDVKNFLIGIGYGSGINMEGKWTFIPYFFFNSYITQIAAKGIMGLCIVIMWLLTKIRLGRLFADTDIYSHRNKINAAFTVLLVSCLTYEFYPYYAFFIIFSIALVCVNGQSNRHIHNIRKAN